MSKPIGKVRVTVTLTVEVDGDDWVTAYGVDPDKASIKADVKSHIANTTLGAGDAEVTVIKSK